MDIGFLCVCVFFKKIKPTISECQNSQQNSYSRSEFLKTRGPGPTTSEELRSLLNFFRDTWVAQSVKRPTLDFGSGHDLMVMRSSPMSGSILGMELA